MENLKLLFDSNKKLEKAETLCIEFCEVRNENNYLLIAIKLEQIRRLLASIPRNK